MSKQIKKIVIVGGGSSGWMTAATLINRLTLEDKEIILIEDPNTPTVGVGEATLGFINNWLALLDIRDKDFMKHCDATYKMSIRFTDFYEKGSGSFHYPFGSPNNEGNESGKNDWYFKKTLYPETPLSDYADCIYPIMALVNENKISEKDILPNYTFQFDVAYHFDSVKFGAWLRDHYAVPRGVKHIRSKVESIPTNEDGVEKLILEDGREITADLFIDCTGFRSLLIGGALKEPFIPYSSVLPNNKAWATQIPYLDKRKEMQCYTDCHAIDNGWVWTIPLWSRIGTGYVYSDKYISDDEALEEFKEHLRSKGHKLGDEIKFRNISMRVGTYERLWVKNVCAIGLSAGFIEPLESNGLYSVHEFVYRLLRSISRSNKGYVSQWDKDAFNSQCFKMFKGFSEFVTLHYALSHRDDTEYWRDVGRREYFNESLYLIPDNKNYLDGDSNFIRYVNRRYEDYEYLNDGMGCIATGLNYLATDYDALGWHYHSHNPEYDWREIFAKSTEKLNEKKIKWQETVKDVPYMYDYLKEKIYYDE